MLQPLQIDCRDEDGEVDGHSLLLVAGGKGELW